MLIIAGGIQLSIIFFICLIYWLVIIKELKLVLTSSFVIWQNYIDNLT